MGVERTGTTYDSTNTAGSTRSVSLDLGSGNGRIAVAFVCGENDQGSWVRENSTVGNDFTKVDLAGVQGYYYREVSGEGTTTIYWRTASTYEQIHLACYKGVDIPDVDYSSQSFGSTDRTWADSHAKSGMFWLAHGCEKGGAWSPSDESGQTQLSSIVLGNSSAGSRGVASEYSASGSGTPTLGWTTSTSAYGIGPVIFLPEQSKGGSKIFGGCFIEKAKDILKRPVREEFPYHDPSGWARKKNGLLVPQGI